MRDEHTLLALIEHLAQHQHRRSPISTIARRASSVVPLRASANSGQAIAKPAAESGVGNDRRPGLCPVVACRRHIAASVAARLKPSPFLSLPGARAPRSGPLDGYGCMLLQNLDYSQGVGHALEHRVRGRERLLGFAQGLERAQLVELLSFRPR